MSTMKKGLSTTTGLIVLAVAFIAAVIVSNALFRGARLDLTENKLYTLTEGTRNILKSIDEPINLYFFFSDKVSEEQELGIRPYANRVRELIEEFAEVAGDGIRLQIIDPQPFSEEEDQAAQFGLQSVPIGPAAENLYFGLAGTNAIDGLEVIPFFQPDNRRDAFLEYDLAKLVHTLANPQLPVVGLLSTLSMTGGFDPMTRRSTEPWVIYTQLDQLFDMRNVPITATDIDEDIDLLVVVHPKDLSEETVYAIDQFVLGGGRAVFFVDPHADADVPAQDPNNPAASMLASRASDLATLFDAWGVDVSDTQFVGDARYAVTTSA
ncbi:MAG: GldG family protein, partial [Gammaproteobacteria bacterium]|nr:GldG family protein [Gammaproteobacteria bacterium]